MALMNGIEEPNVKWKVGRSFAAPPTRSWNSRCSGHDAPERIDGRLSVESAMRLLEMERECWSESRIEIMDVRRERDAVSNELLQRPPESLES